jgi:hypothetical protein
MSMFTAVESGSAFPDAINMGAEAVIVPPHLLFSDAKQWRAKVLVDGAATAEGEETVSSFFLARAKETMRYNSITIDAIEDGVQSQQLTRLIETVCARYAISRLVNLVLPFDPGYTDGYAAYRATRDDKHFLDYTEEPEDLADWYSVIVSQQRLNHEPFAGLATDLQTGRQWYAHSQGELYVAATTPAVISAQGMNVLRVATGSNDNAIAVLDAENSVNLRPYASRQHLLANSD